LLNFPKIVSLDYDHEYRQRKGEMVFRL